MFWIAFLLLLAGLIFWHRRLTARDPRAHSLVERVARHWLLFLLMLIVCLLQYGAVGASFGVPKLFRDDPEIYADGLLFFDRLPAVTPILNSPYLLSVGAFTVMAGIVWTFIRLTEIAEDVRPRRIDARSVRAFVTSHAMPFVPFVIAAVAFPLRRDLAPGWAGLALALLGAILGYGTAMGLICIGAFLATRMRRSALVARLVDWVARRTRYGSSERGEPASAIRTEHGAYIVFIGMQLVLLFVVTIWRVLIPAIAILMLIGWITLAYCVLMWLRAVPRLALIMLVLAAVVFGNSVRYKYSFPNLVDEAGRPMYEDGRVLDLARPQPAAEPAPLLDPVASLEAWRNRARTPGGGKPPLVVVATAGGAYRSAFWTAVVLDELEALSREASDLPGFTTDIRLITGASGGMVAGAYYVALRLEDERPPSVVDTLIADIATSRRDGTLDGNYATAFPISRDSLSPVAQQLVQRDLWSIFWPGPVREDRGRVLEQQWRRLDTLTFAELAAGEADGGVPSLLLTPMMIETGKQLAIGNLSLRGMRGVAEGELEEFFAWFPASYRTFRLSTAVRMNASFPYVSPAVSLPTRPSRRVVDAGYYDNYGIDIATAWLAEARTRRWIEDNVASVIVIEIRAFPPPEDTEHSAFSRAFRWASSPLEGVAASRGQGNVYRNNRSLRSLEALTSIPVHRIVFTNGAGSGDVGMSWYLTEPELRTIREEWASPANRAQLDCLERTWRGAAAPCEPDPRGQ